MTDVDEIAVGWLISEPLPLEADYTPRGGYVIGIKGDDDALVFTTLCNWQGQLKQFDLRPDQIDLGLVVRPSLQRAGPLEALIKRMLAEVAKEKATTLSGRARWLVDVAYQLIQNVRLN